MKKKEITCKTVMDHICESLGEGLNSKKCAAIKNHLNECEDCGKYFDSVEKTVEFYRKYDIDLPEKAHKRLMSILGLEESEKI